MARIVQLEIDFDKSVEHPDWCIASQCCICNPKYQKGTKECETQCPLSNRRDDPAARWLDEYEKSMKAMAYVRE